MASLHYGAPASHLIGTTLRRPSTGVHAPPLTLFSPPRCNFPAYLSFRFPKEVRVQAKQRRSPLFATNNSPSEGSDSAKGVDNSTAPGPPFLTILAGLLVFLGVCWFVGSIVLWLIGFIVHPPALK